MSPLGSRIILAPDALERSAVTQDQFDTWITTLTQYLGARLVHSISEGLSGQAIMETGRRAAMLDALAAVKGFPKVTRAMGRASTLSLHEPHGEWFQLVVGVMFQALGEGWIAFEEDVAGAPKDVALREAAVLVECKSFDMLTTLRKGLSDSRARLAGEADEDGFMRRFRMLGPFGISPAFGYDESKRFFSNGVAEKLHQLVPGRCNILAFNRNPFTNQPDVLRRALLRAFEEDHHEGQQYARLSAFLVLEVESMPDLTSRAFVLAVDLIRNPHANEAAAVPDDLTARLEGPRQLTFTPLRIGRGKPSAL